jgi:hypothetical protein
MYSLHSHPKSPPPFLEQSLNRTTTIFETLNRTTRIAALYVNRTTTENPTTITIDGSHSSSTTNSFLKIRPPPPSTILTLQFYQNHSVWLLQFHLI